MTAHRITAEDLDSMLQHIGRFDLPSQAEFNGWTMRDVLLDLKEARAELDRLRSAPVAVEGAADDF